MRTFDKCINLIIYIIIFSVNIFYSQAQSSWRGFERTGIYNETGLLKSWPETGPVMLWFNQELPAGYSSATFGNNTIFLTGLSEKNDVLVALDTLGKIKWQTLSGRSWNGSSPESRCTPTVEGNRVYVSSGSGDLASIDAATGEIVWKIKHLHINSQKSLAVWEDAPAIKCVIRFIMKGESMSQEDIIMEELCLI